MPTQPSKFRMALLIAAVLVGTNFSGHGLFPNQAAMAQQAPEQSVPAPQVPIQQAPELQTLSLFVQFVRSLHLLHHKSPQNQTPQNTTIQN